MDVVIQQFEAVAESAPQRAEAAPPQPARLDAASLRAALRRIEARSRRLRAD
jgi:hypothetical protein